MGTTLADRIFYSSVSPKGQITLPAEIRRQLKVAPKQQVAIQIEDGVIAIRPRKSQLLRHYQKVPALSDALSWPELRDIAHEEHANHAAGEGRPANR